MIRLGLDNARDRFGRLPPVGRHLYVGLGDFGGAVIGRLRASSADRTGTPPPLMELIPLDPTTVRLGIDKDVGRRDVYKAFLQPSVAEDVKNRFSDGVERCAAMLPMGEMPEGLPDLIRMYVVADLADPFGSAIATDVARLLRTAAGARPHTVLAFLRICPEPGQRPGAFAALRELAREMQSEECPSRQPSQAVPPRPSPCFDRCFLIGGANKKGELDEAQQVALFARLLARFMREDHPGITAPVGQASHAGPARLATAGLSSAYFPRRMLYEYCVARWCGQVCTLLQSDPTGLRADEGTQKEPAATALRLETTQNLFEALRRQVAGRPPAWTPLRLPAFGRPDTWNLPEKAREAWQKVRQSCSRSAERLDLSGPIRPAIEALGSSMDGLVQNEVGGIVRAQNRIGDLAETVRARINQAEVQRRTADRETSARTAQLETLLDDDCAEALGELARQPKPAWYDLLARWQRWLAIRRARARVAAWCEEVSSQIARCGDALIHRAAWEAVVAALQQLRTTVEAEQDHLSSLVRELQAAPAAVDRKHQASRPKAFVFDKSVLAGDGYERFFRRFEIEHNCRATPESVAQLLASDELLREYRGLTAGAVAGRLLPLAAERFAAIGEMRLTQLLDITGLAPRYLDLEDWLSHELWDYAEPLTKVSRSARADLDRQRAEFSAVQVPDVDSLAHPPNPWPFGPTPPAVLEGADCSVHVCRVLQGFPLSTIDQLAVCREAYQAVADRRPLHTVEDYDELPALGD